MGSGPSQAHSQTPGIQTNPRQDGTGPQCFPKMLSFLQPELSCFPSKNLELELQEATNAGQENKKVVFEGTQHTPSSLVTVPEPSLVSHMVTRAGLSPDPEMQSIVC